MKANVKWIEIYCYEKVVTGGDTVLSDLALRRLKAFFIDFVILGFLSMICMGVVFLTADMQILLGENLELMYAGLA